MSQGRPLRAVLEELLADDVARQAHAADPAGVLGDAGHGDLPGDLVAEAIVSFADTAPFEVAEHLAPFVTAHSVVPAADGEPPAASAGLDLLATAPDSLDGSGVDGLEPPPDWTVPGDGEAQPDTAAPPLPVDLGFGRGADDAPHPLPDAAASASEPAPLPGGDTGQPAGTPVEPFVSGDVLPGGPAPYPDEAEDGDGDLPD